MRCEICCGETVETLGIAGWGWCGKCQHGTRATTYDDLKSVYHSSEYVTHHGDFEFCKQQWSTNVSLLTKHCGRGSRVLDIGFLEGAGIAAMEAAGFEASGFDVSNQSFEIAQRNGANPDRLVIADEFRADLFDDRFDAVTCREVIEHVPCVESLLTEIHESLIAGGIAQIQTPVFIDSGTQHWACSAHLRVFSAGSLIVSAERCGLRTIDALFWPGGMCLTFEKRHGL